MYRPRPSHLPSQNADQQADDDLQRALRLSIETVAAHEDPPPPSSPSPLSSSSTFSAHAPFAIYSSSSAPTSIRQNPSHEELALQEDRDLAFALAASLALASDPDPYSPATTATVGPNSPRPAWADAVDDDHDDHGSPWTRGSLAYPERCRRTPTPSGGPQQTTRASTLVSPRVSPASHMEKSLSGSRLLSDSSARRDTDPSAAGPSQDGQAAPPPPPVVVPGGAVELGARLSPDGPPSISATWENLTLGRSLLGVPSSTHAAPLTLEIISGFSSSSTVVNIPAPSMGAFFIAAPSYGSLLTSLYAQASEAVLGTPPFSLSMQFVKLPDFDDFATIVWIESSRREGNEPGPSSPSVRSLFQPSSSCSLLPPSSSIVKTSSMLAYQIPSLRRRHYSSETAPFQSTLVSLPPPSPACETIGALADHLLIVSQASHQQRSILYPSVSASSTLGHSPAGSWTRRDRDRLVGLIQAHSSQALGRPVDDISADYDDDERGASRAGKMGDWLRTKRRGRDRQGTLGAFHAAAFVTPFAPAPQPSEHKA